MTDIKDLLDQAVPSSVPLDVSADLARGRTAARRRRRVGLAACVLSGAAVVGVVAGVGQAVSDGGPSSGGGQLPVFANQPSAQPADQSSDQPTAQPSDVPSATPSASDAPTTGTTATPMVQGLESSAPGSGDAMLVHTQWYDVPPPPAGWHLIGAQPEYVMIARDGTNPPLKGGFAGQIMVLLGGQDPIHEGAPITYDGATFYRWEGGGQTTIVSTQLSDGRWITSQWPDSAGIPADDQIAYLARVQVLPGAEGAVG